jgi:hypothetical protein
MIDLDELNSSLAGVECVRQFKLSLSPDPYLPDPVYHYDLELELFNLETDRNIELIFRDVGELRAPAFGGLTQVSMLRLERNHPGHERRYRVSQLEDTYLSFTCKGVELL